LDDHKKEILYPQIQGVTAEMTRAGVTPLVLLALKLEHDIM
jgi:hypothetical protein